VATPYSPRHGGPQAIPKYALPKTGIPSNAAYQLIHDELDLDGRPNLNVASFVTTYMVIIFSLLLMRRSRRLYFFTVKGLT
jgi:glutamate decarboxylase